MLVHAGAVIADMAVDMDLDGLGQADGAGMLAMHVGQLPQPLIGVLGQVVEAAVELAQRGLGQVDDVH